MEMETRRKAKKQKKETIKSLKRIIIKQKKLITTIPVQFMEDINGINVY